jgi:hypothetical protein
MTLSAFWQELYPWLAPPVGGALGAALLLLPKWGEALIQFRTSRLLEGIKSEQSRDLERLKAEQNRDLERVKAEQGRELERLRGQLNHLADRGRRSNEMEFGAIQTVWKAFVKAWLSTNTCAGAMISIPDFSRMSDEDVKELAVSLGFDDQDQESLLGSADRKEQYVRLVQWQKINEARKDIYQARLTLREQRIFMPPNITADVSMVIERMSEVQVERQLALQHRGIVDHWKVTGEWLKDCVPVFEDLATKANQRLFREEHETTRD